MCPSLEVDVDLAGHGGLGHFLGHPVREDFEGLLQTFTRPGVRALDDVDNLFIFGITQGAVVMLLVTTSGQHSSYCTLACKVLQEPTLFSHREHLEGRSCCIPSHLVSKMKRNLVAGNPVVDQLFSPYHFIQRMGLD